MNVGNKIRLGVKDMFFPKSVLGFYVKYFWRYCGLVALLYSVLAIIDVFVTNLLPAYFLKQVVNVLESVQMAEAFDAVVPVALLYLGMRGGQWLVSLARWYVFDNFIKYKSYNKISSDLYGYVFNQSMDFYTASMPGKINSQIHQIGTSFFETVEVIFGSLTGGLVSFVIAASGLMIIGWQYMLVISFGVIFRIVWGMCTVKKALRESAKRAAALNTLQGRLLDSLSNFMVVKLFARARHEQRDVIPTRKQYERDACNAHFWSRFFWAPGNLVMDTFGFTGFILLAGYLYSIGQSTIADISFALAVYSGVSSIAFGLVMTIKNFTTTWGSAVGSYNSLIKPISVQDTPGAKALMVKRGAISIKNVTFKYNKKRVLKNLTIDIAPGERIGLVGVSGAGKTTLVNLLMRMYDVVDGAILVDGQDIRNVTQDSLRENISFIPQEPTMFNRTLRENIAYGCDNVSDEQIYAAARQASAHSFIKDAIDGYDTLVGDRGVKLSGGQRQRIAIARAFLKNAPILILDEATSALDSETESTIQKSFERLARGRTTIVIAHRLSTLRNMDRIIVLDNGQVIEQGSHNQLVRSGGVYSRLWKMQSGGFIQE